MIERTEVESACPSCGVVAKRMTYDIGSGPELSCANCEWCWGANGQQLEPLRPGLSDPPKWWIGNDDASPLDG